MHRNRGTILAALLLLPTLVTGAELTMRGDTIIRFEEQSTPGMADQTLIPATQFLAVDARSLGDGNLSLHLYGWGRVDLADQSRADGDTDGDLGYAYLQYRAPKGDAEMKLGRLWVYEGVASEKLDGIFLRSDFAGGFTASFFGGAPVEPDHQENVGDYIVGGRLGFRTSGMLELGVSALHENGVVTGPSSDLKTDRQLVGGDVWFAPVRFLEVTGHTHYNIVTDGVAEHSYLLSIKPMPVLQLAGEYEEHNFEHYFASTNLRSLFTPDLDETLKAYGGRMTVGISRPLELTVDFRHYDRQAAEDSDRYGGELRMAVADNRFRAGAAYHRNDAPTGVNAYDELRGYLLYDNGNARGSFDAITQMYDEPIYGKDSAYELMGSVGFRVGNNLALSGDISYGENPRYNQEIRGLVRLAFAASTTSARKGARR